MWINFQENTQSSSTIFGTSDSISTFTNAFYWYVATVGQGLTVYFYHGATMFCSVSTLAYTNWQYNQWSYVAITIDFYGNNKKKMAPPGRTDG
jgi:hypothetical protein